MCQVLCLVLGMIQRTKQTASALKEFAVRLQRHSFIRKVFTEHLHSEPGAKQWATKLQVHRHRQTITSSDWCHDGGLVPVL